MQTIVQDVEIAEALLDSYTASLAQADLSSMALSLERDKGLQQGAAIGSAEQVYPEIWRRLDAARATARQSGRDLTYYDQIRTYVGTDAMNGVRSVTTVSRLGGSHKIAEGNAVGTQAARDAITTFRSVFSDLEWHAPGAPVPELRTGKTTARVLTILGAILLVAGLIALRTQL